MKIHRCAVGNISKLLLPNIIMIVRFACNIVNTLFEI